MPSPNASGKLFVGVDIGGTKVALLLVDEHFTLLGKVTTRTALDRPENTLTGVVEAVQQVVAQAGAKMSDVSAVGLGVPGRVDPATGVVRSAVNLGWREMPAGAILSDRLGVPCLLENDARVAALGVQRYLGTIGTAPRNLAYVSIGTGIAAGLILDGRLYRGAHDLAGEIGHMIIVPGGPACLCGAKGCLEALAAGPAIAALGRQALDSDPHSLLSEYKPITAESVYTAAAEGDRAAQAIAHKVGAYLALALQQLIVTYDMESIVLGGGVSRNGDAFFQPVLEELARLREGSLLTGEMIQPEMIRLLPADYEAGAWGAVVLASEGMVGIEDGIEKGRERAWTRSN